jgi:X box-binding protein 1
MAFTGQKTILIRASGLPSTGTMTAPYMQSSAILNDLNDDAGGPRKRRRLTHLTPDERLMRRKLKNRVAAQTARDRKKQRMDELEDVLAAVESENKRLQKENMNLKSQTGMLVTENAELRERLDHREKVVSVKKEPKSESAALAVPLQKELALALYKQNTALSTWILTLSLMCSLGYSSKSVKQQLNAAKLIQHHLSSRSKPADSSQLRPQWWGPQQQSWNPSMNS